MLTDEQISNIMLLKGTSEINRAYIKNFDEEWDRSRERVKNSGADLGKIAIVGRSREYRRRDGDT